MLKIISKWNDILELAADTLTDLDNAEQCLNTVVGMGSKATVIDTGIVYMRNSSGRWLPIQAPQSFKSGNLFDKNNALYVSGITYGNKAYKQGLEETRMYYVRVSPNTQYTISKTIGGFLRVVTSPSIPEVGGEVTNINSDTTVNEAVIKTGVNDNYLAFYPLLKGELQTITYEDVLNTVKIV